MAKINYTRASVIFCLAISAIGLLVTGYVITTRVLGTTSHQEYGWKAEKYFDDPQVINLCHAIEANDLAEIDRLVAAGADVNAKGKGNMTPLLWAFPDNKLERFTRLLEHGADPNVVVESDFGMFAMRSANSVTHMACYTAFAGYFEAVFQHGGDPNLVGRWKKTPLFTLVNGAARDKKAKVELLIEKGAKINHQDVDGNTAVKLAVGRGHYAPALSLLNAGADFRLYRFKINERLIHTVVIAERQNASLTPEHRADYAKIVKWLTERGESVDEARADIARWRTWIIANGDYRRNMDAEIAERVRREAQETKADKDAPADKAEKNQNPRQPLP